MKHAIKLKTFKNVGFHYPFAERKVLKDVSFNIKQGDFVAIVGENGAGKTLWLNY